MKTTIVKDGGYVECRLFFEFLTMSTIVLTTSMIVDTMLMFMTSFQREMYLEMVVEYSKANL